MTNRFFYLLVLLIPTSLYTALAQSVSSKSDRKDYDNVYFSDSDTLRLYSDEFNGLELLDSIVPQYKVFITGENHTYTESNARLWLKMIKYLHKHAGVRNIMFEYGFSYGWLVNEYLQTGDSNLYNSIRNFAYVEYSEVLKELHEFNASLDSSEKLYLCAIDIERGVYPIAKLLDYLLPDSIDAHDSISIHIQSIESLSSYNDSRLNKDEQPDYVARGFNYYSSSTLELVQENFKKFEEHYKAILGDNFELFKDVITAKFDARNLWYKYEEEKAVQQYVFRETYMHQRFLIEASEHAGGWFGQFGRCHTTQEKTNSNSCEWYSFNSLANRIKNTKGGSYKDSVMTIGIIYKTDRTINLENPNVENQFDKYFDELPENGIVLFDFSGDKVLDSIYSKDFNYLFLNTNNKRGEVYTYYYAFATFESDFRITVHQNDREVNISPVNALFESTSSPEGFGTEPLRSYELSLIYGETFMPGGIRGYGGLNFGYFIPRIVEFNGGGSYTMSGFYVKEFGFYNFWPQARLFDLMLGAGLGYGRLKMTTVERINNPSIFTGYIGEEKNTTYANPAFMFDVMLKGDINISFVTMGAQIGYTLDFSKKNWRSGGELLNSSPRTSLTGLSINYYIGLRFLSM